MEDPTDRQINVRQRYASKANMRDCAILGIAVFSLGASIYAAVQQDICMVVFLIFWNLVVGQWAVSRAYALIVDYVKYVVNDTAHEGSWSMDDDVRRDRMGFFQRCANGIMHEAMGTRGRRLSLNKMRTLLCFLQYYRCRIWWVICVWINMAINLISDFITTGEGEPEMWINDPWLDGCIDSSQNSRVQLLQVGDNVFLRSSIIGGIRPGDVLEDISYKGHRYERRFFNGAAYPASVVDEHKANRTAKFLMILTGFSRKERHDIQGQVFIGQSINLRTISRVSGRGQEWVEDYREPYVGVVVKVRSLLGLVLSVSVGEPSVSARKPPKR